MYASDVSHYSISYLWINCGYVTMISVPRINVVLFFGDGIVD